MHTVICIVKLPGNGWVEKVCKTNNNRQGERVKKDPSLKTWWKELGKDESEGGKGALVFC